MEVASSREIAHEDLERFRSFLVNTMGLHLAPGKEAALQSKLARASKAFGFENAKDFIRFIFDTDINKKHIVTLAKDFTVGETYFFRHHPTFEALRETILPDIISRRQEDSRIRIWSAGCCTGEEAYSIAILLQQLIPNQGKWNIDILGTDINEEFLNKARKGFYKEWSFRDTPQSIKKQYFTQREKNLYELVPAIKERARFDYLNLVEDGYPSGCDLILCNNVLIYFTPEKIAEVVNRFAHSLSDKGWLIVSTIEAPYIEHPLLMQQKVGNLFFFRKTAMARKAPSDRSKLMPKVPSRSHSARPARSPNRSISSPPATVPPSAEPQARWKSLYEKKRYEEAASALEAQLKVPSNTMNRQEQIAYLVKSCANLGNIPKAREWCERGIDECSVDPLLHYLAGMLLQEVDNYQEALEAYKKCLFLDPNFIMAHFSLGTICLSTNDSRNAVKHFENTLVLLEQASSEEILKGTDDVTAERLRIIVENLMQSGGEVR